MSATSSAVVDRMTDLLLTRFQGRRDAFLSETAPFNVKAELTTAVVEDHLMGRRRIGSFPDGKGTSYLGFDADGKNPKHAPIGADGAWVNVQKIAAVLDADLNLGAPAVELTRSGVGYRVLLFFDPDELPNVGESHTFGELVLQAAGLPADEKEDAGHVGVYPDPPKAKDVGGKEFGRTVFWPWSGILSGAAFSRFVDISSREPLDRQESALEDVRLVSRTEVLALMATLRAMVDAVPTIAPPKNEEAIITVRSHWEILAEPTAAGESRHSTLRSEILRLRNFLPVEEVRVIAYALAGRYGLLPDREGEVESLIVGAYLKPPLEVTTEFDRLREETDPPLPVPVNLYGPDVVATRPEYVVPNFLRKVGIALWWAPPGGLKTYTLLRWVHELLARRRESRLTGHPDLWVTAGYSRVLWIATEETEGGLRYRADLIRAGLGYDYEMAGEILYVFAAGSRRRVTLNDLADYYASHGPFDAAVLDSLTGLRPKLVGGRRIAWDVDNDSANELLLTLRDVAVENRTLLNVVHHTGRDTTRYRGATDYWASADSMAGLLPDGGRVKVVPEKQRDGKVLPPFLLTPSWEGGRFTLEYSGAALPAKMTPTAIKVNNFMIGRGVASQAEIVAADIASRSAILAAIQQLVGVGVLFDTGDRVNGSPIYSKSRVSSVSDEGSDDDK